MAQGAGGEERLFREVFASREFLRKSCSKAVGMVGFGDGNCSHSEAGKEGAPGNSGICILPQLPALSGTDIWDSPPTPGLLPRQSGKSWIGFSKHCKYSQAIHPWRKIQLKIGSRERKPGRGIPRHRRGSTESFSRDVGAGKSLGGGAGISAGSIPVPIHPLPSHRKEQPEPQLGPDPTPGGVWEQGIKNRMELDPWECWESPRLTQNSGMDPGICSQIPGWILGFAPKFWGGSWDLPPKFWDGSTPKNAAVSSGSCPKSLESWHGYHGKATPASFPASSWEDL